MGAMLTRDYAIEVLSGRKRRVVGTNTVLHRFDHNHSFSISLDGTEIVRLCEDGTYLLWGGRRSTETKNRINRYGPVNLHAIRGQWFFLDRDCNKVEFQDGIRISRDGRVVNSGTEV